MIVLTKLFTVAVGLTILSTFLGAKAYSAPFPIAKEDRNKVIGVRADDFRKYAKTSIPKLKEVVYALKMRPELYFKHPVLELHGIFFRKLPEIHGNTITLHLDVMIAHNEYFKNRADLGWPSNYDLTEYEEDEKVLRFRDVAFERVTLSYDKNASVVNPRVQLNQVIDLKNTEFEVNVALLDRRVLMTDKRSSLRLVFPTGVGSVDDHTEFNEVRLLTPLYKDSYLDKARAIYAREKPSYFEGKPFIRITTHVKPSKGHTAIGFHIDQNKGSLIRGFVSHGCLRLRHNDLYTMYDIVRFGTPQRISVNTKYRLSDLADHPYPRKNSSYSRLKKYKLRNGVYYRRCKLCRSKLQKTEWTSSPNLSTLINQMFDANEYGERPDGFYLFRVDSQGNRIDMQGRKVDKYGFPIDEEGERIEEKDPEDLDA